MGADPEDLSIGEEKAVEISGYFDIARTNNGLITVSELLEATGTEASEDEVTSAWSKSTTLSSKYDIEVGYIFAKGGGGPINLANELGNRARAEKNLRTAADFARVCSGGLVELVAVSGGNSYKSARHGDDIDLFCVTKENALWIFMLRSLLLARMFRLSRRSAPFCFSYVLERQRALADFGEVGDRLFARDALSAEVLMGGDFYRGLILRAGWMRGFFPKMYRRWASEGAVEVEPGIGRDGNRPINLFLFHTVGSYVRLKAYLLNRRLKARGESSSVFEAKVGVDHCVYESKRYQRLRKMYGWLEAGRRS